MPPVFTVSIPKYRLDQNPDSKAVGMRLNEAIRTHFDGQSIVFRCLSIADHPNHSLDSLIETIQQLGTDKYDPDRKGVLHDFYEKYHLDMFALPYDFSRGAEIMEETVDNFYEGALQDRGFRVRLDLILVYDSSQLEFVPVDYGKGDFGRDGFRFMHPGEKQKALIGIIKIC
ncbi:hypothetical protein EXS71_01965 [Candidatus Uhrbacteria bacterium]|nr:hypothetical protein [Candidatus Uhrbacteria bacterium]